MQENAENSTKTIGKPFAPGVSGNPGGRPRSMGGYIRSITSDGEEIVDLMVAVMRGETINGMKPKIKDQMDAVSWLADRGFGRAITPVEATTRSMNVDMTLSELSTERLLALLQESRSTDS